ncbi:hypothetical protein [Kordiimonas sp.]|uniref:hypothetical protein n=1 Tax=Kordiimonas sp. TaxID=1970157 RepID=UPI003B527943
MGDAKFDMLNREEFLFGYPTILERVGGYLLGAAFLLFLVFAATFKTPEKISLPVVISSSPDAGLGIAPRAGRVVALLAREGDQVAAGKLVAVLAGPAHHEEVLRLKNWLLAPMEKRFDSDIEHLRNLGPLQAKYETLRQAAAKHDLLLDTHEHERTRKALLDERRQFDAVAGLLAEASAVAGEKLALLTSEADIRRGLLADGVGSRLAVQAIESQILDQKSMIIANETQSEENGIARLRLAKQLADLEHTRQRSIAASGMLLAEARMLLLAEIEAWERENLLRASVSGTLRTFGVWSEQRFVAQGEQLFIVEPYQQQVYATGSFDGTGFGQARIGDRVLVSLDDYPFHRFGKRAGEVEALSAVVVEGKRHVRVALSNDVTDRGREHFLYREGMTGTAEIVTAPQTLLSRLWNTFRPEET